jgi:hypothetical protein
MKNPIIVFILIAGISTVSLGQTQPGVNGWVEKQINAILDGRSAALNKETVGQNGKGSDRQRESPSTDQRSTSLVDQSSASDFFSVAANVIPVTPGLSQFTSGGTTSASGTAGSTTATASLYALLAGLNKVSPTDPKVYAGHVFSRRFSVTVGTAASTQATDNTDTPAAVYGTKVLLINGRELYTKKNLDILNKVQDDVSNAAKASASLIDRIEKLIFVTLNPSSVDGQGDPDPPKFANFIRDHLKTDADFQATLASLSPDTTRRIETLIEDSIEPFSQERNTIQSKYDEISKAQQLSISYTAAIRDTKGNNDHRVELIFDYGLRPRINWTVNASGEYTDRKGGVDSKGGRFATSFQGDLTKSDSGWGKTPIRLTFSGEAKWQTGQKPQYTFESKLSIPLVPGVDLPLAYRYANRIAQINQTDSEARLGLSVDISRLAQAFK